MQLSFRDRAARIPLTRGLVTAALTACALGAACSGNTEVVRSDGSGGTSPFDDDDDDDDDGDTGAAGGSAGTQGGSPEQPIPDAPKLEFPSVDLPSADGTTDFGFIPGQPNELLVLAHSGSVFHYRLEPSGAVSLGRTAIPDTHHEEGCGLLSMTFDPEFEENRFVYIGRCVTSTGIQIARYEFDSIDTLVDSEADIFSFEEPAIIGHWHRFGSMGFEEDGETLWALLGEMTVDTLAQDTHHKAGSLLRFKPNRDASEEGYEPAEGNAFADPDDGDPDIYAYGLRSPWRGTRDRFGRFFVADVGTQRAEEVNLITRAGQNLGWDSFEGKCAPDCEGITEPLVTYSRASDEPYVIEDPLTEPATKRAIWLGEAYHHPDDRYFGLFDDTVMFGDFFTGWVRRLEVDRAGNVVSDTSVGHLVSVTSWKTGPDGYMYVLTHPGRLHRAQQVME